MAPREHRSRDGGGTQNSWPCQVGGGLAVIDAFTQVAELLEETKRQQMSLAQVIEILPSYGKLKYHFIIILLV